jgi:hypothetical protein
VKDKNPILHTLTKYHSKAYALCEGVKDFSLKVYGECVKLLYLIYFASLNIGCPFRAPTGLFRFIPRALPWAGIYRAFSPENFRIFPTDKNKMSRSRNGQGIPPSPSS